MSIKQDLQPLVHGEVDVDDASLTHASRDASIFSVRPKAVVHPLNIDDVQAIVKYATRNDGISLTVRSGGTDMSGGALTDSVVVDMASHINRIGEIHGNSLEIEPGAFYKDMEKKTSAKNLLMPSYPASKNICTVGGMVNNNAGGEKNLQYGKTEKYIESLRVVLADAQEYELRPLSLPELKEAMQEKTFLGKAYRATYDLLEKNYKVIHAARPKVSKNSAGYALWDVWDRKRFDLTKLFCGSQGTLGITTNITFRLIQPQQHAEMLIVFLDDLARLGDIINDLKKYRPESIESYDDHTLFLATKIMPRSPSLAIQFLPEFRMLLIGGIPKLVLIAEFTGSAQGEVTSRLRAARAALEKYSLRSRIARNAKDREKYWHIRRESFNLLRHAHEEKKPAPFIDDFIVLPQHLPEFLPKLAGILERHKLNYTIAGHAGDGNFHIIPLMNLKDRRQRDKIPNVMQEVHNLVFQYHGSSTAEHNDGLIRSHALPQMFGPEIMTVFEQTKHIFDPKGIFNPGKKVHADWQWAQRHITG
ncbi:MAG: hypothetical protein A3C02_03955 [Candidatus Andersenbacteria bacterium RIFCSPHIGHO2_02_FULL_45_11]|uniref:FAD-binding PCMH-type domain-containing protein n=1 Tax=Candidatus Andersenbacteria bacterium RIFCSPHIGHO2_12_FULL_45_11 TaxID=1797281 RepID=A0A1G1WZA2_9BACT|nr:MAG: hypothetical protein A2805_00670 [Candidatus Andersenbacteria bacterium RIFCSPHIGHO2_01_FULL_46_36]OGY33096.1 MAG: hypothetical protein A3D99_01405 [Candidatus Andersenbacteria bacterium RIFCSPHIGHO2_12_FULL_45_11]OGY33383.1 MAG: hypothetical protein A3C02_03955 [Candidatus Andersenbacteria bacterium RIFCSPHIGHO2_02_FULL_45_11]